MLKSQCVKSNPGFFSSFDLLLQVLQIVLLLRSVALCDSHASVSKESLALRVLLPDDGCSAGALGMRRTVWGEVYHTETRKTCMQFLAEQSQTSFLWLNHFFWHVLQFPIRSRVVNISPYLQWVQSSKSLQVQGILISQGWGQGPGAYKPIEP